MLEEKIRVRAKAHAKVPFRGTDGLLVGWRFVGRDRVWPHDVLAEGEELTLNARNKHDVLRAIADGDLERVKVSAPVVTTVPAPAEAAAMYGAGSDLHGLAQGVADAPTASSDEPAPKGAA